ncbi:aldose 1-epimerase [Variovorax rhizosphaerae]|uniref:Aldose 1-epimerase n=1 Tax=Variovorax rhizosphaerae TaxID=1836200 RepID=A0ABU8WMH2_9BURK
MSEISIGAAGVEDEMSEIIELRQGAAFVRVAPAVGGRITQCRLSDADGQVFDVLHPYPEEHSELLRWAKGGMYPLVPYWGRIANAQLRHAGERIALCPHPDAVPHTLHGTAHQSQWQVVHRDDAHITLHLDKHSDAHWPWHYSAQLAMALRPASLRVEISVSNADVKPMPAGIGLHPYIHCHPSSRLQFTAHKCWVMTQDFLSLRPAAVDAPDDFSADRSVGLEAFTHCYSEWEGGLRLGSGGDKSRPSLRIVASPELDHLVLHRPPNAPYICIEPVSHTANAFNLAADGVADTGTRLLAPGQRLSGAVEFRLE